MCCWPLCAMFYREAAGLSCHHQLQPLLVRNPGRLDTWQVQLTGPRRVEIRLKSGSAIKGNQFSGVTPLIVAFFLSPLLFVSLPCRNTSRGS